MRNESVTHEHAVSHVGLYGAAAAAIGVVTSGPIAMVVVAATKPQPPWVDARTFAEHFHAIQLLPFLCGLLLVTGFVAVVATLQSMASPPQRAASACAMAFATIFGALISFNYIVQVSFVPSLVRDYSEGNAALIAAFSMTHPGSFAWSLEMWGYAFLGAATWLVAPIFAGSGLETVTRWAFILNGPVSIAGAAWTVADPGWEQTSIGLVAFSAWNLLALLMAASAYVVFRWRLRGYARRSHAPRAVGPVFTA